MLTPLLSLNQPLYSCHIKLVIVLIFKLWCFFFFFLLLIVLSLISNTFISFIPSMLLSIASSSYLYSFNMHIFLSRQLSFFRYHSFVFNFPFSITARNLFPWRFPILYLLKLYLQCSKENYFLLSPLLFDITITAQTYIISYVNSNDCDCRFRSLSVIAFQPPTFFFPFLAINHTIKFNYHMIWEAFSPGYYIVRRILLCPSALLYINVST